MANRVVSGFFLFFFNYFTFLHNYFTILSTTSTKIEICFDFVANTVVSMSFKIGKVLVSNRKPNLLFQ